MQSAFTQENGDNAHLSFSNIFFWVWVYSINVDWSFIFDFMKLVHYIKCRNNQQRDIGIIYQPSTNLLSKYLHWPLKKTYQSTTTTYCQAPVLTSGRCVASSCPILLADWQLVVMWRGVGTEPWPHHLKCLRGKWEGKVFIHIIYDNDSNKQNLRLPGSTLKIVSIWFYRTACFNLQGRCLCGLIPCW